MPLDKKWLCTFRSVCLSSCFTMHECKSLCQSFFLFVSPFSFLSVWLWALQCLRLSKTDNLLHLLYTVHQSFFLFAFLSLSLFLFVSLFSFLSVCLYVLQCFRLSILDKYLHLVYSPVIFSISSSLFLSSPPFYLYICMSVCLSVCAFFLRSLDWFLSLCASRR